MAGWQMNHELEEIWSEETSGLIVVLARHLPGGAEEKYEIMKNSIQDSRWPSRNSNQTSPK
jgi:hypothetical protein